jgi:diguanylate cyclase (GGDEF)-like protein
MSVPARPAVDPGPSGTEALMQFLYQAPIGLVQTTLDGRITMINPMSAQLLMPLAPLGELGNLFEVLQGAAPLLRQQAQATPPGGTVCEALRLPVRPDPRRPEHDTWRSLRMLRLDADTLMASISDITAEVRLERERVASKLRDAGRVDALTGLPNRIVALESIENALAQARGPGCGDTAVLFINGDRFNRVNVTHGPAAGDAMLRMMAARIGGALRRPDSGRQPPGRVQTAARLGADEFVVVLEGLHDTQAALVVAQRLVQALNQPYSVSGSPVHGSASVGVVLVLHGVADAQADPQGDAEAVLQDASLAMREAKCSGGARWCLFEPALRTGARQRADLESELRQALQGDQLFVVYQPIRHLASGAVAGVEALVRWQHPRLGVVSPQEFIQLAEETGLIVPLGLRVLQLACQQFAQWRQQLGAQAPRVLSVNLSRAQLTQPGLLDSVRDALSSNGLEAGCLQLEITESLAAEDAAIQARLHQLKRMGVLLALDDFGTGYSSLASLHLWPVDVIKIDRSFVSQIDTSPHHRVLVEATMLVARSLGMATVAEGVETSAQACVLAELHCDKVQGYLYARPLRSEAATAWLRGRTTAAAVETAAAAAFAAE